MEPLIAGAPFVRALEELVAAVGKDSPPLDPAGARDAFFAGQSAMALTWPTGAKPSAAGDGDGEKRAEPDAIKVGFAELPGATQMFNFATGKWDNRNADESVHVPVVPLAGLTGVVSKQSLNAMAAFELLVWLSGEEWGTRVASVSPQTTLFRRSQLADIGRWVEASIDRTAARQYGQVVSDGMARTVWVDGLRIRGSEGYYKMLGQAVTSALEGTQRPADALSAAAEAWRQTTEQVGLDSQKAAYRRSLGLDP
jgi:multiple sugar transport system substrate-binding protein